MLASLLRPEPLDPTRPPPGVHPEEWALYVPRERRHRAVVRTLVGLLVAVPLLWAGWRIAHPPPDAPQHQAAAALLFERGNARAALVEIRLALQEAPDVAAARHLAGLIHLRLGAYTDAVKELRRARALGLEARTLDVDLATALLREGQPREALQLLESSAMRERDAATWHALRGSAHRALGEAALAEQEYQAALERSSNNARALRGLARLTLGDGRYAEASAQAKRAIESDRRDADSWQVKGDVELAAGEAALAEEAYRTAVKLNPFRREAHAGLARALLAQRELELAALEVKTLTDIAPSEPDTWFLRGELARLREEPGAAADAWQQVLKTAPGHGEAQLSLGRLYAQRGQHEQAMALLSDYVAARPLDVSAVADFARLALTLDAPGRALEALAAVPRQALADPALLVLVGTATLDTPQQVAAPFIEQILAASAVR